MSVADILSQLAANAGRRQLARGALIGNTIAGAAAVPGQIVEDREKHALLLRQQAIQDAQLGFARNTDLRAQKDQALQDAAAQRDLQKSVALRAGIAAGFGDGGDPKAFDVAAAQKAVTDAGFPELATTLADVHAKLQPKLTSGAPGSVMRDEGGHVVPGSEIPDKKPDYTINGQRFSGATGLPIGAVQPTQAVKSIESKNVLLDGKPAIVNFNPATGAHTLPDGTDVSTRVKPMPPASTIVNTGAVDNVKEAVAGMKEGSLPPVMPSRASKDYTAILAESRRQGFELGKANLDWTATMKHVATMNGAQQLRLNQAVNALPEMLDKVDALASQWKGGKFPILNKANLALAKGGAYGSEAASIANQLDAQIADVTADLGNVYMGGNSPTDHALGLAGKSLKGEWDEKVLHDMVKLAKTNVTIRRHSIDHTGVAGASADNPYAPPPAAETPPAAGSEIPANVRAALKGIAPGRHTLSDGTIWLVGADGSVTKGS